ncbi:unnamed protein product [Microthlaspi erraticum]|uniref:Uncharacterized protein n=1 Tax=Microthlaspi erraticum TaxID=1685480 RepID=A0A6D2HS24_9BRAS|nr:unnamed protein product [Microthlaspi erraticum]
MASHKLFLIAFLVSLSSSMMINTCSASRHLLQQQPLPQIPNFPIPAMGLPPLPSTLPQPTLPTIPTSIPSFRMPNLPAFPSLPTNFPSIPFFTPPPSTTSSP